MTETGQFVFTPTAKARLDAERSPTLDVAAFTVTVTDGTATDTTAVLATIDASDHAHVVSPDGYQANGPAVVGPDGTIYQTFRSSPLGGGKGTTKIVVIDPTTATPTVIDLDGQTVGKLVFDPDTGIGYQTLWTVDPETEANTTTIAVFSPGDTTPTLHPFDGRPFRPGVLAANGTFYQGIPHESETTLVRVGPGGVSHVTLSGTEDGLLVVNPDTGTAYVPLQQGDLGNPLYSLAIVEPGDGEFDVTYFSGSGRVGPVIFHDGGAYQTVNVFGNRTFVIDLATSELLFEADGHAVDPVVFAPDGTAYLVTLGPGPNLPPTAVTFLAPGSTTPGALYEQGVASGPIVFGDDGVGYLTLEGDGATGVQQVNGQRLFYSVDGTTFGPVVFGPDGGVYQTSHDVFQSESRTLVTTIGPLEPAARVPGRFHDITFGADGKPIVTTDNDDTVLGTGTFVAVVDGSGWAGQFFEGTDPSFQAVVGPDGTVYQLMRAGGGTTVGIVSADASTQDTIILVGLPEGVMVAPDGFVYVTTVVFDPVTGGNESIVWALDARGEEIGV